jgi:hypothetical protein
MIMHKDEYDNWVKVKDALEEADKTDSYYYKRAVAILAGNKDPHTPPDPTDPA